MWLIVGLGNPGEKYEFNRHNIGFLCLDQLQDRYHLPPFKAGFSGLVTKGDIEQVPCVLLKPLTFMNLSGSSLLAAMSFHKCPLEQVLVIHDELDLPFGALRLKMGGGAGGHNGLKDIIRLIGPNFLRLRLGIGRPPGMQDAASYVLTNFMKSEEKGLNDLLNRAVLCVASLMKNGLEKAQNEFHQDLKKGT